MTFTFEEGDAAPEVTATAFDELARIGTAVPFDFDGGNVHGLFRALERKARDLCKVYRSRDGIVRPERSVDVAVEQPDIDVHGMPFAVRYHIGCDVHPFIAEVPVEEVCKPECKRSRLGGGAVGDGDRRQIIRLAVQFLQIVVGDIHFKHSRNRPVGIARREVHSRIIAADDAHIPLICLARRVVRRLGNDGFAYGVDVPAVCGIAVLIQAVLAEQREAVFVGSNGDRLGGLQSLVGKDDFRRILGEHDALERVGKFFIVESYDLGRLVLSDRFQDKARKVDLFTRFVRRLCGSGFNFQPDKFLRNGDGNSLFVFVPFHFDNAGLRQFCGSFHRVIVDLHLCIIVKADIHFHARGVKRIARKVIGLGGSVDGNARDLPVLHFSLDPDIPEGYDVMRIFRLS